MLTLQYITLIVLSILIHTDSRAYFIVRLSRRTRAQQANENQAIYNYIKYAPCRYTRKIFTKDQSPNLLPYRKYYSEQLQLWNIHQSSLCMTSESYMISPVQLSANDIVFTYILLLITIIATMGICCPLSLV